MKRCVIFGGAGIINYQIVRDAMKAGDFVVCCDSGLVHAEALGILPDLIVGDFDSHENPHLDTETIVLPCEKDDTDSCYALKEMLRRGYDDFLLAGMIGERLDHSMVNLSLLMILQEAGAHGRILDDYSEIEMISGEALIEDRYSYFSLLAFNGPAEGVSITGAKYPLTDGRIDCYHPYATSNEVRPGQTARVTLRSGSLLLVKVF